MQIVWDETKLVRNLEKHGFDFSALDLDFFKTAVIIPAKSQRMKAINVFNDKVIVVIFYLLGSQGISIISMRPVSRAEREFYESVQAKHSTHH